MIRSLSVCRRAVAAGTLLVSGAALASVAPRSAAGAIADKGSSHGASSVASATSSSGVKVLGWGFAGLKAVASDGSHVWVANFWGQSLTEFPAS